MEFARFFVWIVNAKIKMIPSVISVFRTVWIINKVLHTLLVERYLIVGFVCLSQSDSRQGYALMKLDIGRINLFCLDAGVHNILLLSNVKYGK